MKALSHAAVMVPIRLRRDGATPLRFLGREIARHDGYVSGAGLWHELALYRDAKGGYVVAIVARMSVGAARCHAAYAETLDAALSLLEMHEAGGDLCPGLSAPPVDCNDPTLSPADVIVQAAALRCALEDVERRYRMGVGHFLLSLAAITI